MEKSENILSIKELPPINQRVRKLIEHYAGGSVKLFSEQIELSNSQRLNRIFNLDKRNNEYPIVSSEVLIAIANMFSSVDINWILTGRGNMLIQEQPIKENMPDSIIYMVDKIDTQSKEIGRLEKEVEMLQDKIQRLQSDVGNSKDDAAPGVKSAIAS